MLSLSLPPKPGSGFKAKLFFVLFVLVVLFWLVREKSGTNKQERWQLVTSTGTVRPGETLSSILTAEGLNSATTQKAVQEVGRHLNLRRIQPGDSYKIVRTTFGRWLSFSYQNEPLRFVQVDFSTMGAPSSSMVELAAEKKFFALSGKVQNTLWESMTEKGVPPEIIYDFAEELFAWQIDFLTEVRQGDEFKILWERYVQDDEVLKDGKILAASYNGKETGEHKGILFEEHYYSPEGKSLRKMFLKAPLNYRRISSQFTLRRFHPILRTWRPHHGTDYAAPAGTPVVAIGDGKIVFKGRDRGYGNKISIRHAGGYTTHYAHLSRFAPGVRAGVRVNQGQLIGAAGATGLATGPHLHFEIEKNGRLMNFQRLKFPVAQSVSSSKMKTFQSRTQSLLELLDQATAQVTLLPTHPTEQAKGI